MNEEIDKKLEEEILNQLEELKLFSTGSAEKEKAVETIETLYKLRMDSVKAENEADEKAARRVLENTSHDDEMMLKERELLARRHDDKLNRIVGVCVNGASIVLPLIFYGIWMRRGFQFEKEGSITSKTFQGLIGKFKTTK